MARLKLQARISSVTAWMARWVARRKAVASVAMPACGDWPAILPRDIVDQPPDALREAPGAFDARLGPLDVALGRRVRQHEPAGRIGAVICDDLFGIDDVLLGFGHLLDAADRQHLAVLGVAPPAVALVD